MSLSEVVQAGRVGVKDRKCAIDIIRWSLAYAYVAKHSLRTNKVARNSDSSQTGTPHPSLCAP